MRPLHVALAAALLVAGCGGSAPRPDARPLPIEALRARAAASPQDPASARALAVGELLEEGGDAARARAAIERALALRPDDPVLHLASAIEHEQHGRMEAAFESELAAIDAARSSDDPLAPWIAEVLIGFAGGRETDVPRWRERFEPALQRAVDDPGRLGMAARLAAARRLRGLLRRRGEGDAADGALAEVGCLPEVRVAGPFGPFPMLGFDRPVPAEGPGPMAERYDVGSVLGPQPTRTLESTTCGFSLGGEERGPGVWVAEATVRVEEAGRHVLHVVTPNTFRVRVDGEAVGGLDRRTELGPSRLFFEVALSAGEHEVEVVLATRHPNPYLGLALGRPAAGHDPAAGAALDAPDGWLGRHLSAFVARNRGDRVAARERVRGFDTPHATATRLIVLADVIAGDPHLPGDRRHDRSRQLLERAAEADPAAWYPRYRGARFEQRAREGVEALRAVATRFDSIASLQLRLAEVLRERGDTAAADDAVARARALVPTSCEALSAEIDALRARGRVREADARVDELLACNARSRARFRMLFRQRRWDDARAEIERLAPLLEDEAVRGLRRRVATATGDEEALDAIRAEIAAEHDRPVEAQFPTHHVDALLAAGRRRQALGAIDEAIERRPRRSGGLRRIRRALTGEHELLDYRLDGREAIEAFEASGRAYDGASHVLVLDYMVVRVNEDGSSQSLVHQIYRVQSEEAIERLGQLSLPGYVLTLRSIKPDGSVLEPDAIRGLDHAEMPSLAIGDYVEYEFIRAAGPTFNGGFRSGGWVFQNFSYPFDRSQLVLVAPHDLPVTVEARGPVPEPEERRDGALTVRTWTVEESRPLEAEPDAATSPERLPHLELGVRATWDAWLDRVVDGLMDDAPRDPAIERLVRRVVAGARGDARVRRLYDWVLENVEAAEARGNVPQQILARRGEQNRILQHLLEVAGVDARIVLSRALGGRSPGELFRDDVYQTSLVMVRREGAAPLFLSVGDRGIPFGYVPSTLRGQPAVVLEPGHPRVEVSDGLTSDLREVSMDVAVNARGGARVEIEETLHGAGAYYWRSQLEGIPDAELPQRFEEGYVARMFPQSRLVSLEIRGTERTDRPVVLRYVVQAPVVGRPSRGDLVLAPFFRAGLARSLAQLPERETTERVLGRRQRVRLSIRGPGGAAPQTGEDVTLEGPDGARARVTSRVEDGALVVERELAIPPTLITPDEYAAFARFCRDVDTAEARAIRVPMAGR
ncbi:MAG TPA: DUF3857 domain-containing protein [Sandaracinaceae bacterium LLY-WYZ-13_1]|nr:DUF3857 domain-containing protein [Sandaracinaceae bacterium LLY-WYZ-13_1]